MPLIFPTSTGVYNTKILKLVLLLLVHGYKRVAVIAFTPWFSMPFVHGSVYSLKICLLLLFQPFVKNC